MDIMVAYITMGEVKFRWDFSLRLKSWTKVLDPQRLLVRKIRSWLWS